MKTLNKEQRKFLKYIQDNHKSMGYPRLIKKILRRTYYTRSEAIKILTVFIHYRKKGYTFFGKLKNYLK